MVERNRTSWLWWTTTVNRRLQSSVQGWRRAMRRSSGTTCKAQWSQLSRRRLRDIESKVVVGGWMAAEQRRINKRDVKSTESVHHKVICSRMASSSCAAVAANQTHRGLLFIESIAEEQGSDDECSWLRVYLLVNLRVQIIPQSCCAMRLCVIYSKSKT